MIRLTPVVKNIIIINVIFFIAQLVTPRADLAYCIGSPTPEYVNVVSGFLALWNLSFECFKPFQLFTYMFLHGDIGHIFFNMLGLAILGPMLESYWGPKKFTIFYMVTGVGAGLFSLLVNYYTSFGGFITIVGASGAIYGILTAASMVFPEMELRLMFLPISFKAKYLVVFVFVGSIVWTIFARDNDNTAHTTHLGGIIFAFFMITAWRRQGGGHY